MVSTDPRSMARTAKTWLKDELMHSILKEWKRCLTFPGQGRLYVKSAMEKLYEDMVTEATRNPLLKGSPLGRLALKPEAAGKIRVFAIVDNWTQ